MSSLVLPTLKEKFSNVFRLRLQRTATFLCFPLLYNFLVFLMRFCFGYKIKNILAIRRQYRDFIEENKSPFIICANHLTKVDSLLVHWALASSWDYFFNFKKFSWNLPERKRYQSNLLLRLICYLGCCIAIDRGGQRSKVLDSTNKVKYLLSKHNPITIFPEGKRSTTGRINTEDFTYGVGRLVSTMDDCKVLCIYLRGKKQEQQSSIPKAKQEFFCDLKVIEPKLEGRGLSLARNVSKQIITELAQMEDKYFAYNWE